MITCMPQGVAHAVDTRTAPSPDAVRRQVWSLLAGMYPQRITNERRRSERYAFPQLLYLLPSVAGGGPQNSSIVVVGKTLSEGGLGFFHREPIAHRQMIALIEDANHASIAFLIDIRWCRFTVHGWYESGSRLLDVVDLPVNSLPTASVRQRPAILLDAS